MSVRHKEIKSGAKTLSVYHCLQKNCPRCTNPRVYLTEEWKRETKMSEKKHHRDQSVGRRVSSWIEFVSRMLGFSLSIPTLPMECPQSCDMLAADENASI